MNIENKVHDSLGNFPFIKKMAKRAYQVANVMIIRPKKSDGKISRVTPNDDYEYLFGYYDKSPWDITNRYILSLRVKNASKNVAPNESADIVLIDTENDNTIKEIAKTGTWNVQQGCMLGWLGPDYKTKIFYNDFRDGRYCGVIMDIKSGSEKVFEKPFYSVSNDGKAALSLDFSRLHRLRPGYGYSNLEDKTKNEKIPDGPCVWKIDLKTEKIQPILTYKELFNFEHRDDMDNAEHKVNHLMLSPDGKRFMLIHRWIKGGKKISRLLTCDINGKNLYNLSDDNMVSHCCWKNDKEILAYCRKDGRNGYFLMKDKTRDFEQKWEFLSADGHPSYSPDGNFVVTDTYPNKKRISTLRILSDTASVIIGKVYSPFKYDNDTRCDLHPRWSRDGKKVCFDGCFEGKRGVYVVNVDEWVLDFKNYGEQTTGEIEIMYIMTSCRKCGPTQQTLNIIKNLDRKKFNPILVTIYEESADSCINEFIPYVSEHYTLPISKKSIILKKDKKMQDFLSMHNPDAIHSVGVFPDYLVSTIGFKNHIFTLRNYAYEDYPAKFGKIKGNILAKLQIKSIKNTNVVVSCSKSLQKIYQEKLDINTECIQNGVDTKKYKPVSLAEKKNRRKKLGFSDEDFIWIYSGQFIERKNIPFMIEGFLKARKEHDKLLLLGDGVLFDEIKKRYEHEKSLVFMGVVDDVQYYLSAADVYISASRSEGLPNGVLEAMATGLPVLLSDIPQHEELLNVDNQSAVFGLDNLDDYCAKIKMIREFGIADDTMLANRNLKNNFSDKAMSRKYQLIYEKMEIL